MARSAALIELSFPISCELFYKIDRAVREAGFADAIEWSENVKFPTTAAKLAAEAIYVICNSGMSNRVAVPIFERCMAALKGGMSVTAVFGHEQKAAAIDDIWRRRVSLFRQMRRLRETNELIGFCADLPWIGSITKYHLAKNLGADVAKPDVHLNRLADAEGVTAQGLCVRLAQITGYRVATIDMILWRASADGIIHSR